MNIAAFFLDLNVSQRKYLLDVAGSCYRLILDCAQGKERRGEASAALMT